MIDSLIEWSKNGQIAMYAIFAVNIDRLSKLLRCTFKNKVHLEKNLVTGFL